MSVVSASSSSAAPSASVRSAAHNMSSRTSSATWLAPIPSAMAGGAGLRPPSPSLAAVPHYDRARLIDFIVSTNTTHTQQHSTPTTGNIHSHGRTSIYTESLTQVSRELARVSHISWEKVSRLAALCPSVPPTAVHPELQRLWHEMESMWHTENHEKRQQSDADSDSSDDEASASALSPTISINSPSSPHATRIHFSYSPSKLALIESIPSAQHTLDTRFDAVIALGRFVIQAVDQGQSASQAHVGRILPVLIRFLVSLPFLTYDPFNFPSITPKIVTNSLIALLAELAIKVPETRKFSSHAIESLIQYVVTDVTPDANAANSEQKMNGSSGNEKTSAFSFSSSSSSSASRPSAASLSIQNTNGVKKSSSLMVTILEGLLTGLSSDVAPFPLSARSAEVMATVYHQLFQSKYTMTPMLYGLTLRCITSLLARHPDVFTTERMKYLFEHEFMRAKFQFPAPNAQPLSATNRRASQFHNTSAATSALESVQTLILVQTINLGVLIGLIANSRTTPDSGANCTEPEEQAYKARALQKIKEMLDQMLNVNTDGVTPAATTVASSSSTPNAASSPPLAAIGCVDAARALLNGVMELAAKYASDRESIPHIVDAIKTILLNSRRLSRHPKEKQLRYLFTISISKVFKLELSQAMQQSSSIQQMKMSRSTSNFQESTSASSSSSSSSKPPVKSHDSEWRHRQLSLIDAEDVQAHMSAHRLTRSTSSHSFLPQGMNGSAQSIAVQQAHHFSNSYTRTFVQSLLAALYKDESAAHSSDQTESNSKAGVLYQRMLLLLLDLVSLIDYQPLTQLVLPTLISRLTTYKKYLHSVIPQLTDIAALEENRYASAMKRQAGEEKEEIDDEEKSQRNNNSKPTPLGTPSLVLFDSVLDLLLSSYAHPDLDSNGVPTSVSKKTLVEIPSALLRIAGELRSVSVRSYLLKKLIKVTLDLANDVRQSELNQAQSQAEAQKKSRKKSSANPNEGTVNTSRIDSCGFLLPVLAALIRECYQDQLRAVTAASASQTLCPASSIPIGLQLYANPETNAKWFRRLWFFLTSFHFTDSLMHGAAGGNTATNTTTSSNSAMSDHWSSSIQVIAFYSPLLINPSVHQDYLSTELSKEYDVAFRKVSKGKTPMLQDADAATTASNNLLESTAEKITLKLNLALADAYKKQVASLFPPALMYEISQLAIGRVLFLLSVVHLETIRIQARHAVGTASLNDSSTSGQSPTSVPSNQQQQRQLTGFHSLFAYLSHYPLQRMDLIKYVSALGDRLYNVLADRVFNVESTPTQQHEVTQIVMFLITHLASRRSIERATARTYLMRLTSSHPHLQWNTACLNTLLELLYVVQSSLDTSVALAKQSSSFMFTSSTSGVSNDLARMCAILDLPDDIVQRREIYATLITLSAAWLDQAKGSVPDTTNLIVQEFIQRVQRNLPRHVAKDAWHTSLGLVLRGTGGMAPAGSAVGDVPGLIMNGLYNAGVANLAGLNGSGISTAHYDPLASWSCASVSHLISELNVKERYIGEIKGLYRSYQEASQRKRKEWNTPRSSAMPYTQPTLNPNTDATLALPPHRPHIGTMRSMSVLIQQESANAFTNLLARHVRTASNASLDALATASFPTNPATNDGPQIPPFGKLLTAKLIQEGAQILASFHAIHDTPPPSSNSEGSTNSNATEQQDALNALHARFERLLCLTTALLIWSRQGNSSMLVTKDSGATAATTPDLHVDSQDLLHLLVKTPSQLFTSQSIEVSVFVWQWLLQAERSFELPLMIEMKAAFGYTIDRQVGLFSHRRVHMPNQKKENAGASTKDHDKKLPVADQTPDSPVSGATDTSTTKTASVPEMVRPPAAGEGVARSTAADPSNATPAVDSSTATSFYHSALTPAEVIAPHFKWLVFLLTHFRYLPSFSRDVVHILASMMHKACARPELLSVTKEAFGARMRLVWLALRLVQSGGGITGTGATATAPNGVVHPPPFLDLRDRQLLRDRIYLSALTWFQQAPVWHEGVSPDSLASDVGVVVEVIRALKKEEDYWQETPTQRTRMEEEQEVDLSYPIGTVAPTRSSSVSSVVAAVATNAKSRISWLTQQRNLLVFLLSHELDRLYTWHAPLGSIRTSGLPAQVSHGFTTRRGVYAPEWKAMIHTAWNISPKLCVRFCERFQQSHIVTAELTSLVQQHPEDVYELPEAVTYLVTDEVLRAAVHDPASSQLRHLIYWAPTTLPTAVWFLGPPFCTNRFVLEYAVHTLRSHPPENVMFYLSQIIQCLRNDSQDGILYHFLLEASKASVLLSHQLLWLAQAELGEVKTTTKYVRTPFRQQIEKLIDDVVIGFDEVERTFYEQEFEFFEKITAISGILKPIPTKAERKEKIKEKLLLIEKTTPNIYLPTNPQLQVVDIICTSGSPMQSAAKVPILVAFKVRVGDLNLEKERREYEAKRIREMMHGTGVETTPQRVHVHLPPENGDQEQSLVSLQRGGPKIVLNGSARLLERASSGDDLLPNSSESVSVSRLDAEEIELMVDPELSESRADGATQQINTAMARNRAAKLAEVKSTANAEGVLVQACIFKVGDDTRQDALALQVIQWCKNIMQASGLELWLYPYRVLPTRTGADGTIGGIIECVPNASTRDEIGKSNAVSLLDHYINKFGPPESAAFQQAQRAFIISAAGYAVCSYILQVKDRHNGNVMIDESGHLIHIDFGFIFDISPARNMKFESAGFKLTLEMVELMSGRVSDGSSTISPMVLWFQELVVRGFLAIREHRSEILALVEPMLSSTLECFKPNSLSGLKARFFPDCDEAEAAVQMLRIVDDAWNKWTTNVYDMIQNRQQGVFFFAPGTSSKDPQKKIGRNQTEEE